MKYNPISRRMFLQGSSGTMLAIPFLTSLLPRELWAAPPGTIKRFISIIGHSDLGHHSGWLPNTSGNINNLVQPNRIFNPGNGQKPVRWQPLREFAPTNTSVLAPIYGSAFSPYLNSMSIMRGLDLTDFRGHDSSCRLGGLGGAEGAIVANMRKIPTIDHVINNNRTFNPKGSPVIYAGEQRVAGGGWSYSFVAPNSATPATHLGDSLQEMYNRLFSNGNYPEGGTTSPAHPRRDILTRIMGDYTQVRNSRNISLADRTALDNALDKISDVQRGLAAAVTSGACSHKSLSQSGLIYLSATFPAVGRAVADMITASIMCDSARTFTIGAMVANPGGTDYVAPGGAVNGVMDGVTFEHDISTHNPFLVQSGMTMWQRLIRRQTPVMQNLVAPLIQNLSAATDPSNGQSYLYNSLVFSTFEGSQTHSYMSQPVILFGNAGGDFGAMGNYIDYSDRTTAPSFSGCDGFDDNPASSQFSNNYYGVHYNRLLVNILQAMGIPASEYEGIANNSQLLNRSDLGTLNANLTSVGGYGYPIVYDLSYTEPGGDNFAALKRFVANYDIKQFRNKLPMPT